jgi:hypothetical protein
MNAKFSGDKVLLMSGFAQDINLVSLLTGELRVCQLSCSFNLAVEARARNATAAYSSMTKFKVALTS